MKHSIIPPSSAGIWGKPDGCTAWVLMNQTYPETEPTPESMEGTASHEIGAKLIDKISRGFIHVAWSYFEGRSAANGVIFTEEMFDGANLYAQNVGEVMRATSVFGGPNMAIEKRLNIPGIHELSFGTPDCYIYSKNSNELFIWDYKFGYEVVDAFENWQAINYLEGLIEKLQLENNTMVRIHVNQPRAYHRKGAIREWKIKTGDLRDYFEVLRGNAIKSLGPDAEANSGSHCKHCPGRHACPAALTGGMRLYEAAAKPMPVELSRLALGVQLTLITRARKQLEYLESGYKEQVSGLIKSGSIVPGWGVEQKYGHEKWDKPFEEVVAMGDMLGQDLRQKKAITPKQALKLGIDATIVKEYSSKPRTGLVIVPDNGNKAKQVFSQ